MDTKVMFVWLIVIVFFSVLVVFLRYKNKKSVEKKLFPLFNFVQENNSEISSYDSWDKTLIGLENSGVNKLFFIRKVAENEVKKMINLSEIKNCHMAKTTRTAHFNKENVIVTDKIDLVLSYSEKNKPDVVLEFYNTDYDSLNLTGELQFAEKWSKTINAIIGNSQSHEINVEKVKTFPTLNQLHAKAGV